jgi:hypothetical protein
MSFFSGLLTILKALPAIVRLVEELSSWLKTQFGDDPAKFILDSSEAFKRAKEAKTPDEKAAAAGDIARLIKRL